MKKKILFLQIILFLIGGAVVRAQDRLPREYVRQEELVSLKSDLDFSVALDLLSEFAIKFSGKPIHDPEKRTGPIGIDISSMPWQKALELILSRRGLWYTEKDHFFEIINPDQGGSTGGSSNLTKFSDGTELDPRSKEVKIEAIFFEGDRKTLKEIGIDWSTFYQGEVELTANQVGALSLSEDIVNLTVKVPNKLYGIDVKALLRILDSENIGQVLAQPHIIAVEGNEGNIQVGQDFSIKQRDFAGNVTDRFYSTGTIMRVTPYIFENPKKGNIIFLKIHVERSQAYPDVVSTIIKKSEANTLVQLYNGEETLIGGLYSSEKAMLRKGIPLLKDLPWWFFGLRYLFGYNRSEEIQKELIIIIKASLLPDVFSRTRQSKHQSSSGDFFENPQLKIRQLRGSAYSIDRNKYKNGYRAYQQSRELQEPGRTTGNGPEMATALPAPVVGTDGHDDGYTRIEHGPQASSGYLIPAPSEQGQHVTVTTVPSTSGNASVHESGSPVRHYQETRTEIVYYRGQIVKVQNHLALIQWQRTVKPDEMQGKEVTVLRKDRNLEKFIPIGKVRIVKAVKKLAVAQPLTSGPFACPELKIGDRVVAFF